MAQKIKKNIKIFVGNYRWEKAKEMSRDKSDDVHERVANNIEHQPDKISFNLWGIIIIKKIKLLKYFQFCALAVFGDQQT